MTATRTISTFDARLLLMHGAGLFTREVAATPARTLRLIHDLGFVQLDSIHVVERAHHHILWSRLPAYAPRTLETLQQRGDIFEHWTHDASLIPSSLFPQWRHRFERVAWSNWLDRQLGASKDETLAHVLARIEREGPLKAADFEHVARRKTTGWWDWKPAKAALEYLWRRGELAIPRRDNFHKVYDLTSRVLPHTCNTPAPPLAQHIDWACRSALQRLGTATPTQIARFWNAISITDARNWCTARAREGELLPVHVATTADKPLAAFALHDVTARIRRAHKNHALFYESVRVLNPFDPILRDRARCAALFGFDYRFEAFTPAAKRQFGYYVLPILAGDRVVARFDPLLDRRSGVMRVTTLHWEATQPADTRRALLPRIERALQQYAAFCGATTVIMPRARAR
jgi:uncharacterized protein